MEMLQDVITKLQTFEETTSADPAVENSQEGSDLSLELNQSQTIECNKEQVRGKKLLKKQFKRL